MNQELPKKMTPAQIGQATDAELCELMEWVVSRMGHDDHEEIIESEGGRRLQIELALRGIPTLSDVTWPGDAPDQGMDSGIRADFSLHREWRAWLCSTKAGQQASMELAGWRVVVAPDGQEVGDGMVCIPERVFIAPNNNSGNDVQMGILAGFEALAVLARDLARAGLNAAEILGASAREIDMATGRYNEVARDTIQVGDRAFMVMILRRLGGSLCAVSPGMVAVVDLGDREATLRVAREAAEQYIKERAEAA